MFQQLVTSMAQPMYRLAARIVGNTADAQDVLQEGFLRAYSALKSERFEGRASMRTWLYRIVTNAALDHLRARQRRARWQLSIEADGVSTSDSVEALAALRELDQWLSLLPADQRAAIVLKEMEGMTSAEVGSVLGCTEGAVEQKLIRARTTLRERNQYD